MQNYTQYVGEQVLFINSKDNIQLIGRKNRKFRISAKCQNALCSYVNILHDIKYCQQFYHRIHDLYRKNIFFLFRLKHLNLATSHINACHDGREWDAFSIRECVIRANIFCWKPCKETASPWTNASVWEYFLYLVVLFWLPSLPLITVPFKLPHDWRPGPMTVYNLSLWTLSNSSNVPAAHLKVYLVSVSHLVCSKPISL